MSDYLLDEDEDLEDQGYFDPMDDDEDSEEDDILVDESLESSKKLNEKDYEGKLTSKEVWLISAYDDIIAVGKDKANSSVEDAGLVVIMANPKHTSKGTAAYVLKDLFQKQGHARRVNSLYTPDSMISGEEVNIELKDEEDSTFNTIFTEEARDQIARFIDYLVNRDLSQDSVISRRRKQRHIPAFIILLFSSGLYDLIINCPTMPVEYSDQISGALRKILQAKYDVVEELAVKYESVNRQPVADRVRKMQLAWFFKEPAEIRTSAEYSDLQLTHNDIVIYREYRSKFTNMSKAITQDVISDLIEVVIDKNAGIYEKLKDKTRSDAISDVKQVYQTWSKVDASDAETATKVIYKDFPGLTK